jgi:hypothetical protein
MENYPCHSSEELRRREGEIIRATDCINKNVAGRTPKESMKAYAQTEKGKAAQKRATAKFNQKTVLCECGRNVKVVNLPSHKRTMKHVWNTPIEAQ